MPTGESCEKREKIIGSDLTEEQIKDMENRFTYHAPDEGQKEIYEALRKLSKIYAKAICSYCPISREQAIALTKLEEATFWANASIVRN